MALISHLPDVFDILYNCLDVFPTCQGRRAKVKKIIIALIAVFIVCGSVFGGTANLQFEIGSNQIKVNGKPVTLPQPVVQNEAGVMVPLELLTKGLGAGVNRKGDSITVTMPETPDIEFVTDKDKGLAKLLSLFDQARHFVYVQMYEINNGAIIDKIVKTRNRGVKILVILDENYENRKSAVVKKIVDNKNCYVHLINKTGWLVYHKKVAIFDGYTVFTGSSNWTNAGFGNNDEQNFIIRSKSLGNQMKEKFLNEWNPKRKKEESRPTPPHTLQPASFNP
jgi:phosphatidylserine/phosphatidylglycerophosphate/cardiolipin synthase-like enzyme